MACHHELPSEPTPASSLSISPDWQASGLCAHIISDKHVNQVIDQLAKYAGKAGYPPSKEKISEMNTLLLGQSQAHNQAHDNLEQATDKKDITVHENFKSNPFVTSDDVMASQQAEIMAYKEVISTSNVLPDLLQDIPNRHQGIKNKFRGLTESKD